MKPDTLTLKSIDQLAAFFSGDSEAFQLFKVIRESFKTDSDLEQITSILSEELAARIHSQKPQSVGVTLDEFYLLKSSLNQHLQNLTSQNLNPMSIIIGEGNTFTQSTEHKKSSQPVAKSQGMPADSPPRRAFKPSEITFKLPVELQKEFQQGLDRVKAMETSADEKLQEMLEKEKALEEIRLRLEQENADLRLDVQKKLDEMHAHYEKEKELLREEVSRTKSQLEIAQKTDKSLVDVRNQVLIDFEEKKTALESTYFKRESTFNDKFEELSALLKQVHDDEKSLAKINATEQQRLKKRGKQLNTVAEQQKKKSMELIKQDRLLLESKKKLKARLEKQYQEKLKELQEDFNRKSEYHYRRQEEEEAEKEWVLLERQKLVTREQAVSLLVTNKTEERCRELILDYNERLKALGEREKLLLKSEEELLNEKNELVSKLKAQRNTKVPLAELNILVEEQQKIVQNRKTLLDLLSTEQGKWDKRVQDAVAKVEKDKAEALASLKVEYKFYQNEIKILKEMKQVLVRRETTELARLNREYDELKTSIEVAQIEKEEALEKTGENIKEDENKLREAQLKWMTKEQEETKRIETLEEESLNHLSETYKARDEMMKHHDEVSAFMRHFHSIYRQHLEQHTVEFATFKKNIETLTAEAERLTRQLEEKEKNMHVTSAATEQALGDRLKQREKMVDNMENDLRERLQEYRSFVSELQQVKGNLVEQDQARKTEMMDNLSHYESRLTGLAKAFEDLSVAFQTEKSLGRIEIAPENESAVYSDGLAKMEWRKAIKARLYPPKDNKPILTDLIYKFAEKWDQWVHIPQGKFQMGRKLSRNAAPFHEVIIGKSFQIKKYPVTNIEFYQFINETNYKTEAESGVIPIVYHNGHQVTDFLGDFARTSQSHPTLTPNSSAFWLKSSGHPDDLEDKYDHPVTQVTWNDAVAYCAWKSQMTGLKYRLPTECEWEYVAGNFGKLGPDEFYWDREKAPLFCNIEETEIGDTTPVDFFPEQEFTGGTQDMFGNVYEWVNDSPQHEHDYASNNGLTYKLARGGSFITHFKDITHWRQSPFASNYCSSFLGFRICLEE